MGENVRMAVSRGGSCVGWCGRPIQRGDRSLSVSLKVPALFTSVNLEGEMCVPCGTRLRDELDTELRKANRRLP